MFREYRSLTSCSVGYLRSSACFVERSAQVSGGEEAPEFKGLHG